MRPASCIYKDDVRSRRKRRAVGSVTNFYNFAVAVASHGDGFVHKLPNYANGCQMAQMIPLDIFSRLLIRGWQFDYFFEFKKF